jgi:hypothetical protein
MRAYIFRKKAKIMRKVKYPLQLDISDLVRPHPVSQLMAGHRRGPSRNSTYQQRREADLESA